MSRLTRRARAFPAALLAPALLPAIALAQAAQVACPVPSTRRYAPLLGDWRIVRDGEPLGRIRVALPTGGCLVEELEIIGPDTTGVTTGYWDRGLERWVSSYVGHDGTVLRLSGRWRDSTTLVLTGSGYDARPTSRPIPHRLTLARLAPDTVRQLVETSADGGRMWRARWDVRWVR